MNKIVFLIISILILSCQTERKAKDKPTFILKRDFLKFPKNISNLDTIKIKMLLSNCTYEGVEKLTITRKNDSIIINSEFYDSFHIKDKKVKQKPIKISINDTVWKFDQFLDKNRFRITDSIKHGRLRITHNRDTLIFRAKGLSDSNNFIGDYCLAMKRLNPKSKNHIFGEPITIEYIE